MSTLVYIYSTQRESALKLDEFVSDTSGKRLKKTKIGRTTDGFQALYSPKVGGLKNGLSYKPWLDENGVQKEENGVKLTLQDKMERKWNLPKGFLTNKPWRKGQTSDEFTYYQTTSWRLADGSTVLDLNIMNDELAYYVYLDSKYVGNSEKEWREHKWPYATHYIALENEAEELKYKKNERKSRAFASLHSEDMTPAMKRSFIYLLELANSTSELTDQQAHNLLFDYIDTTTFTPGSNIDKFLNLYTKLETPGGRSELEAELLLMKLLTKRVISEKQGAYFWVRPEGTIELGVTKAEAIDFILNPKKQTLVDELEILLKTR